MCHILFVFFSLNLNRRIIPNMVSGCAFGFFWRREHNQSQVFHKFVGVVLKRFCCALHAWCLLTTLLKLSLPTKYPFLRHWQPRKKWPNLLSKKRVKKVTIVSPHIIDTMKGATLTLTMESIYLQVCMVALLLWQKMLVHCKGHRHLGTWPLMEVLRYSFLTR